MIENYKKYIIKTEQIIDSVLIRTYTTKVYGKNKKYKLELNSNTFYLEFSILNEIIDVYNSENYNIIKEYMENIPYFLKNANKRLVAYNNSLK